MVLEGVIRKKLLEKCEDQKFQIEEAVISKRDLENAQEIWLTNSVKGIRFVEQFEVHFFQKENSVYQKIINLFGRYGELS